MGLCKTSNFSIFTFIKDNVLKFFTRSCSSCVYRMIRFKGSNGKVCKTLELHAENLTAPRDSCASRGNLRLRIEVQGRLSERVDSENKNGVIKHRAVSFDDNQFCSENTRL